LLLPANQQAVSAPGHLHGCQHLLDVIRTSFLSKLHALLRVSCSFLAALSLVFSSSDPAISFTVAASSWRRLLLLREVVCDRGLTASGDPTEECDCQQEECHMELRKNSYESWPVRAGGQFG
jgi:hypothetical protein